MIMEESETEPPDHDLQSDAVELEGVSWRLVVDFAVLRYASGTTDAHQIIGLRAAFDQDDVYSSHAGVYAEVICR